MTETALLNVVALADEAAVRAEVWPKFLRAYADIVRSDIAILQCHYFDQHRSTIIASTGMSQPFTNSYNDHYSQMNIWRERGARHYATGRILRDDDLCPRTALERTEFYNDYLCPNGSTRCLAAVLKREEARAFTVTALRSDPEREWDSDDMHASAVLLPHVTHAFHVHERFQNLRAAELLLERQQLAVLLVSSDGRIRYANRSAESILGARDGLMVRDAVLRALDASADAAIRREVLRVTASTELAPPAAGVPVSRPSAKRPYYLKVCRLARTPQSFAGVADPAAVIFLIDPDAPVPAPELMMECFGLTRREAALAVTLAQGSTVAEAASHLGVTYETARTHLRRVLEKTETSRQSDLVRIMSRLSTPLQPLE